MFGKILSSPLKPVTTLRKSSTSDVDWVLNLPLITSENLQPLVIFAKLLVICLLNLISIVHGLYHVTLFSTYLLNNENYNSVS